MDEALVMERSAAVTWPDGSLGSQTSRFDPLLGRALDVTVALAILLFFLPLMVVVAISIVVADPGPVFFSQTRIGKGGRLFRCFKFRTMATDAEARLADVLRTNPASRAEWARDHKLRVDPRIVGIGYFLRKSSLDELPQLFNVLRNEMSMVGPRPIVEAETVRYGRYFAEYCKVNPGLTGLWQISGRNNVSYRRRIAYDVAYCRSRSITLDFKIILLTLPSVLLARGSY